MNVTLRFHSKFWAEIYCILKIKQLPSKEKLLVLNGIVRQLNWVVSLVTVFEELSHVMGSIGSRDKVNWGIRLFDEQVLRRAHVVVNHSATSTCCLPPLSSKSEKSKWFPPFYGMVFNLCSLNTLWLSYGVGRELSSFLVLCTIQLNVIL